MVMRILTIYGMLLLFGCANVPEPDGHPDAPVSQSASEQELKRIAAVTRLTRSLTAYFVCDTDDHHPRQEYSLSRNQH